MTTINVDQVHFANGTLCELLYFATLNRFCCENRKNFTLSCIKTGLFIKKKRMEEPPSRNERSALTDRTAPKAEQAEVSKKGTSLRTETVRSQQEGTGLQRMGVKRSDAEGGTEMDAV